MPTGRVRRNGELIRGVFRILEQHPDGLRAHDVLQALEDEVPPTAWEAEDYPNRPGVRRYEKTVRFASIASVKAGWLVKDLGLWFLTDEGRQAFADYIDPDQFQREAIKLYKEWKRARGSADEDDETEEGTEAPSPSATLEEAEETAWTEIHMYLQNMPPFEFQDLVASLLMAMDYHVAYVAPAGPDRGIDIVAFRDPLGASQPRIKVQFKRRKDSINAEGLRAFMAVLGDQDVGIFVSTGGFTSEAQLEARTQERRRLTLIDARRLFELWIEHLDKMSEEDRNRLPLRRVHFLAPSD
jgi:restriction system protein